jgi:hypothetical protein
VALQRLPRHRKRCALEPDGEWGRRLARPLQLAAQMPLALFALIGVLLAAMQSAALSYNVELYLCGASVMRAAFLHVARMAVLAACFTIVAIVGLHPLLATAAGFVSAQVWLSVRRTRGNA